MKPPANQVVGPRTPLFKPVPAGAVQDQPEFQTHLQTKLLQDKKRVPMPLSQLRFMGMNFSPLSMVKPCREVNDIYTNPRFGSKPFNTTSVSARPIDPLSKLGFSYQRLEPLGGNLRQNNNLLRTSY